MITHSLAAGLCLLVLPLPQDEERLVHRPEAGTELVRTYRVGGEMHMVEFSFEAQGEEHAPDEVPELMIRQESRYVVRDELLEVEEGELRRMRRTYETLDESRTMVGPGGEATSEREGDLEGQTVLFTWDGEEDAWKASAEEEGAGLDRDLLDGLQPDLSLAAFLPPGEVEEGATWSVPAAAAGLLLRPLGDLGLRAEDDGTQEEESRKFNERLQESLRGTIEATYRGTREVEGLVVAIIALEIEVQMDASVEVRGEGAQEVKIERELTGELLWDTAAGRLRSAEISGQTFETTRQIRTLPTPEGEVEVIQRQRFEGSRVYTLEVSEG